MNISDIGHKESLLSSIASPRALTQAWRKVRANRGGPGGDAVSLLAFERGLHANIAELSRNLLSGSYEPLPIRQVSIAKRNGGLRELAIPSVRDRVAQRAALECLEPLFEPQFLDCSYAFRPGRSVPMAVHDIAVARSQGRLWTLESDVASFFPSIDHDILLAETARTVDDRSVLRLLRQWLEAGALVQPAAFPWKVPAGLRNVGAQSALLLRETVDDLANGDSSHSEYTYPADRSIPDLAFSEDDIESIPPQPVQSRGKRIVRQAVRSGLMLAIANRRRLLHSLTPGNIAIGAAAVAAAFVVPQMLARLRRPAAEGLGAPQGSPIAPLLSNVMLHPFDTEFSGTELRLVRYCDDFVVLGRSRDEAKRALETAKASLASRRLDLHPDKTRIVPPDGEFEFLGYTFGPGNRVVAPPSLPDRTRSRLALALRRAASRLE